MVGACGTVWAGDPDSAVITRLEGSAVILSNPGATASLPGAPLVKYNGISYNTRSAQVEDHLENGNILRTFPDAKARVVYPNGDCIRVSGGTAYRVQWGSGNTQIEMMNGKLRATIKKGGPRRGLTIRTKAAVMGVRGTDLYVVDSGKAGSQVSVLRGAVEVTPQASPKKYMVKTGFTGENTPNGPKKHETTRSELKEIVKESKISSSSGMGAQAEKLEALAKEAALEDIKAESPQLHAQVSSGSVGNLDELDEHVEEALLPKAPAERKPFGVDLDRLHDAEKKSYDKFFNK